MTPSNVDMTEDVNSGKLWVLYRRLVEFVEGPMNGSLAALECKA